MKYRILKNKRGTYKIQHSGWFGWRDVTLYNLYIETEMLRTFDSLREAQDFILKQVVTGELAEWEVV